ncbi:MAG: hypothetical protein E6R08_06305 [Nevskiaceae bacterium]|nr:MAG: hypothetical protein E6R08_06305 [Nevskiaceae bacterium]
MSTLSTYQKVAVVRADHGIDVETYDNDLQMLKAQMYRFCVRNMGKTSDIDEAWAEVKKEIEQDYKS